MSCLKYLAFFLLFSGLIFSSAGKAAAVEPGETVVFHFVLTINGEVVESTYEREPFTYVSGEGGLVPGLEQALAEMRPGDKKSVDVSPEEGFGPINQDAVVPVPKEQLPEEALEVGTVIAVQLQGGQTVPARVIEINDEGAMLDFNHPLAGQELHFDIEVLSVS